MTPRLLKVPEKLGSVGTVRLLKSIEIYCEGRDKVYSPLNTQQRYSKGLEIVRVVDRLRRVRWAVRTTELKLMHVEVKSPHLIPPSPSNVAPLSGHARVHFYLLVGENVVAFEHKRFGCVHLELSTRSSSSWSIGRRGSLGGGFAL